MSDLLKPDDLRKIADDIEFPLMDVLVEMEMTGVRVNRDVLAGLSKQMEIDLASYEKQIYEGANHAFNNDTGQNYNQEAAVAAWQRTLDWFGKYLKA